MLCVSRCSHFLVQQYHAILPGERTSAFLVDEIGMDRMHLPLHKWPLEYPIDTVKAAQLLHSFAKRPRRLVPGLRNCLTLTCCSFAHRRSPRLCNSRPVSQRCVASDPLPFQTILWAMRSRSIIMGSVRNSRFPSQSRACKMTT